MKVGITRNMVVASDAGGTVSFKKGQEVDVSPAVFGRLERAGAGVSLERLAEDAERPEVVPNVAEAAVSAEAAPGEPASTDDGAEDKGTKGKRRRTVPLIPEIRDLVAQRSDGCARLRHRQVLRRTGADTSSSNTFAPETRSKR